MKKLLYVLPEYRKDAHTHFSYIPKFLELLGTSFEIKLLVERGDIPVLSRIEARHAGFFSMVQARFAGYRTCYVHYSFKGALMASIVFRLTGGTVFYWNCGLPWQYPQSFLRRQFERLVYHLVTFVVTGTEKLADQYARKYGISRSKVLVMPNWIDVEETRGVGKGEGVRKELGITEAEKMVLFAHRLSPRKGAHYLVEIAKTLPETAVLIVVGDGPLRDGLERRAKSEEFKNKIRFLGWQPHDRVLSYMKVADVYIMPSDEEGFPHTLLEAMALGTPFVATDVGGVSEMVPPTLASTLVPKGDMHTFTNRLSTVLSLSQIQRDALAVDMSAWVRRYDSSAVATVCKRILENV